MTTIKAMLYRDASASEFALAAHTLNVNRAQRARDAGNNAAARHYARNARLNLECYRFAKARAAS